MVHKLLEEKYVLCMLFIGILGSFLFLIIGYWISGAIGFVESENVRFIDGLIRVFDAPFASYFNNYTPVIMALAFITFEFLFYLYMLHRRKKERMQVKQETEKGLQTEDIQHDNSHSENIDELGIVFPIEVSQDNNEREAVFSDDIAMELFGQYDMEQIKAMLKVTKYIEHVSTDLLKRMFKPSMPAEDISAYIEMFYE